MSKLQAPFPYFGGKSKIAGVVWQLLGDVSNYVEPFGGSLAVLLARPAWHRGYLETVNDKDGFLVNFWRAVQAAPDEVARWATWPVSEADLTARHWWLITEGRRRIANLEADPFLCDAQVAGWWVWGMCCWIGGGWCAGDGPWVVQDGKLVKSEGEGGVNRKKPHLGRPVGIHKQLPSLAHPQGVLREVGSSASQAVVRGCALVEEPDKQAGLVEWMRALAARLARVRICCGDWSRVVTRGALAHGSTVGIFLDPPYSPDLRADGVYSHDEEGLSARVREWAIEHGRDPRLRIVLCGYEGEHDMPDSWQEIAWRAGAAYKTHHGDLTRNRFKERLWASPACNRLVLF